MKKEKKSAWTQHFLTRVGINLSKPRVLHLSLYHQPFLSPGGQRWHLNHSDAKHPGAGGWGKGCWKIFPLFIVFICLFIYSRVYLSIWLCWVLVAARGIFVVACGLLGAACGILFPDQGSNPGPPALGARSLNHWTTREIPFICFKHVNSCCKERGRREAEPLRA